MMPPLPKTTLYDAGQCLNGHTDDALEAYGQACRSAALEEAISVIEATDARRVVYLPNAIEIIRRLK